MRRGILGLAARDEKEEGRKRRKKKKREEREGGSSGRGRDHAYWLALEKEGFYYCLWLR